MKRNILILILVLGTMIIVKGQEQQAQQQKQMMAQAGLAATPNAVNQVGEMVRERQADGNKTQ